MTDLITALRSEQNPEGLTTAEILEQMGIEDSAFHRQSVLRKLKLEIKAGRVMVAEGKRFRIDGRPSKVPVYRVV